MMVEANVIALGISDVAFERLARTVAMELRNNGLRGEQNAGCPLFEIACKNIARDAGIVPRTTGVWQLCFSKGESAAHWIEFVPNITRYNYSGADVPMPNLSWPCDDADGTDIGHRKI